MNHLIRHDLSHPSTEMMWLVSQGYTLSATSNSNSPGDIYCVAKWDGVKPRYVWAMSDVSVEDGFLQVCTKLAT